MFWVYILKCSDNSFYTGHTDKLEFRLHQHDTGYFTNCFTFNKRPLVIVFAEEFATREQALERERQIKGWSRAKKIALIESNWTKLIELSKSYTCKFEN